MRIVDIVPKKITVLLEWDLLENCTYKYNSNDPESLKAKDFLENKLYPFLTTAKDSADNGS